MSADNGIYILVSETENGQEYRVAHDQAIENCAYSEELPESLTDSYIVLYFADSEVFTDKDEALTKAREIYDSIIDEGFGIVEYGICFIEQNRSFPKITKAEAEEVQNKYWDE